MSALSVRLEKAAARIPAPVARATEERRPIDFAELIAKAEAETAFLESASPVQLVAFHRDEVARLEKTLAMASERSDRPLVEVLRKAQKVWIPSFLDDARAEARNAELAVIKEAGFSRLDQPGAREHLELALFAA